MEEKIVPASVIALRMELPHHPELMKKLADSPTFETCLADIATYCDLIVDGYYDVDDLCEKLVWLLKQKRVIVVNSLDRG